MDKQYEYLTCPFCYHEVRNEILDVIPYISCHYCKKIWFQEGQGLPAMSAREEAHYQIIYGT